MKISIGTKKCKREITNIKNKASKTKLLEQSKFKKKKVVSKNEEIAKKKYRFSSLIYCLISLVFSFTEYQ